MLGWRLFQAGIVFAALCVNIAYDLGTPLAAGLFGVIIAAVVTDLICFALDLPSRLRLGLNRLRARRIRADKLDR